MASNMDVYRGNLDMLPGPLVMAYPVQAGSTAAIYKGELLTWNETSGYFIPISAAADAAEWLLAVANEEIDADNAPAARYADVLIPRPADLLEIPLAAAAAIQVGHNYVPTGTNSQTATADPDGYPVFTSVGQGNYPRPNKWAGTTIRSQANGLFTMNYEYSFYKRLVKLPGERLRVLPVAASLTLLEEWSGMILSVTAAATINLPQDCPIGTHFHIVVLATANTDVVSAGGGIVIKGAKQADNKYVRITDEGDFMHLAHYGSNDWLAIGSISGADGDISVQT